MVSQFVSPYKQNKLSDLNYIFPEGTNAVGRLDYESEGLLILTTDKTLTKRLFDPQKKHKRNYTVQVNKIMGEEGLQQLNTGVDILIKGQNRTYTTEACIVKIINKPNYLPERENTLRENLPNTWLEFVLTEGKNRQIRKMCKAVKHKCKRLIRTKIENLELGNLKSGEVKELDEAQIIKLLNLY